MFLSCRDPGFICAIAGQKMHYFDESLLNRSFHSKLPLALAKNAAKGKLIKPTGYMESSEIDEILLLKYDRVGNSSERFSKI